MAAMRLPSSLSFELAGRGCRQASPTPPMSGASATTWPIDQRARKVLVDRGVGQRLERPDPGVCRLVRRAPKTIAAGVARRPARRRAAAPRSRARVARPISTTIVAAFGATLSRSGAYADSAWPDTTTTPVREPRCVTGMPASAGAASADDTPGTTSTRNAGGLAARALLPRRGRRRTGRRTSAGRRAARARGADHQPVDRLLRDRVAAGALADVEALRATREVDDRRAARARRRARDRLAAASAAPCGVSSPGSPGPAPTSVDAAPFIAGDRDARAA